MPQLRREIGVVAVAEGDEIAGAFDHDRLLPAAFNGLSCDDEMLAINLPARRGPDTTNGEADCRARELNPHQLLSQSDRSATCRNT
jgi:hypothetical protein